MRASYNRTGGRSPGGLAVGCRVGLQALRLGGDEGAPATRMASMLPCEIRLRTVRPVVASGLAITAALMFSGRPPIYARSAGTS